MSTLLTRAVTSLSGTRMSQSSKKFIVEVKLDYSGLILFKPAPS